MKLKYCQVKHTKRNIFTTIYVRKRQIFKENFRDRKIQILLSPLGKNSDRSEYCRDASNKRQTKGTRLVTRGLRRKGNRGERLTAARNEARERAGTKGGGNDGDDDDDEQHDGRAGPGSRKLAMRDSPNERPRVTYSERSEPAGSFAFARSPSPPIYRFPPLDARCLIRGRRSPLDRLFPRLPPVTFPPRSGSLLVFPSSS